MPQVFYILFGAGFTAAVALALGRLLLRGLRLELHRQEENVLGFLAGAACLSLLVFALAMLGLARKGVFLAAGLLILAAAFRAGVHRGAEKRLPALPVAWRALFFAVFTVFTFLYFFNAAAPEASPDGSTYHLGLVSRYLRARGFEHITTHMYANLSQGLEMLFLFAFSFGRHSAAALVHFAFLISLPLAMLVYGRRFGFPVAGAAAALFTYASPVVAIDGTSAYNDVAVAAILFGLFYALQIWDAERDPRLLVVAGLLAGFGYAVKYTALLAVPYALGFVAWKQWRARKPVIRPLAVVAGCALLLIVPWVAKNWFWLGNPFSPFFNAWFPNPYVHVSFEEQYRRDMRNYEGVKTGWEIPLEATARGQALAGLLGPLFLLAPVALLAMRYPAGRRLLLAAAVFGSTYPANIGTRFLIPVLPFASLAMALVVANWKAMMPLLVVLHAFASWPSVLSTYCATHAWRLEKVPIREARRRIPEEEYLSGKLFTYLPARMVEDFVPAGERVFAYTQVAEAYTTREVMVAHQAAFNEVLGDILRTPLIPEWQPTWRLCFRFPERRLSVVRVAQTASGGPDLWSVSELRVYQGGKELPRAAQWRLQARPNPWDVQLAFDNSPVTCWRSWQTLYPGMRIEVDFGGTAAVDAVCLEASPDQYKIMLKLEGRPPSGQWETLSEAPEHSELPRPLGLRRAAVEELKARGIRYLLMYDSDFGADEFRKNPAAWGITPLAERLGARLYRFD